MSIRCLEVSEFLNEIKETIILDVRSPAEYNHAHIPGAINLPLFSNEERKIVGTAYKQESREKAIKLGLDFFGPKMRKMVEDVEEIINENYKSNKETTQQESQNHQKEIHIYCWRGGMRSAAVAWLLDLYGFKVAVLEGGYKKFRNYVLDLFAKKYSFKVIGGYTGSGKTEVLGELQKRGERTIDLEKIASHKGSAFGSIKMPPQPSQEMFENLLCLELSQQKNANSFLEIWIEDESQRIGDVNIPTNFWIQLRNSPLYFLEIPFEERLNHLVEEYGQADKARIENGIIRISKRLGGLETKNALQFLSEDNIKECFQILLKYYDKSYTKALHTRENLNVLLRKIPTTSVSNENAVLLKEQQMVFS